MTDRVYCLQYHWYMGVDGAGMSILGIYTDINQAENARKQYLSIHELSNEEYDLEWINIEAYTLNVMQDEIY